jgi:hypothetical protein
MRQGLDCMLGEGEARIQLQNCFNGHCCHIRSSVIMQNNSFCHYSSVFTVNSGFQLHFKYSTSPCMYCLSMIPVVLEDRPINVPKQCEHHFAGRRHTSKFLAPRQWCVCFSSMLRCLLAGS